MDACPDATGSAFVGRADEVAAVGAMIDRAAGGSAGALLISGDAGVGKSALVERACSQADPSAVVLAGACLPLTALTVPFLALRSALRSVSSDLEPPVGLMQAREAPSSVPVDFDLWLAGLSRDRPVILTVDDLHWADQSTLDVLMYLLAGPSERRLAVIATVRSGATGDGHPLQHWLADVRRFPRIEQLALDSFDRMETSEHLAGLMGTSPHQSLVDDVFARTRGNAYLNRLLVKDLAPNARLLPSDHPVDLSSAVLQSWQVLPGQTRELTRILAVGGGPLTANDLSKVAEVAVDPEDVQSSLLVAVEAGILDLARNGSLWFHHPMIAEVLEQNLTDHERRSWHTAFAERAEKQMSDDSPAPLELMIAAADHHDRAGNAPEAYRWALCAAESAGSSGSTTEELRLLQRALDLRGRLPGAQESERDLLQRMVSAAAVTGAYREELRAVDLLLGIIDSGIEPLRTAELLVHRADLRRLTGLDFHSERDVRAAVDLSAAADPDSWQHAYALASLVRVALWQDDPATASVEAVAERALAVARGTDSSLALSCALSAKASVCCMGNRRQEGLQLGREAVSAAVRAHDFEAYLDGSVWELSCQEPWSPRPLAIWLRRRREQMTALGAPHAYGAILSAVEADAWLRIGDWRACQDRLREALGSDPGPFADVQARLAAAQLAVWQGRTAEAQGHLARADELFVEGSRFLAFSFDVTRALVSLAAGDPETALAAALAGASSPGAPPERCEWLMPLAARALADLIEADRDAGRDPHDQMVRLADLITRFPSVIRDSGQDAEHEALYVPALNDLYQAEIGRAQRLPENGDQWIRATSSCRAATIAWEEAYACWRAAESLLAHSHQHREQAASVLRRGLALATELGAEPIRKSLEALASSARIGIEPVTEVPASELAGLPGLTTREREILAHVVAGRTYREIARELVISEKTVSSHISNLLRKTGADNRVDLSRLATRSALGPSPPSP